MTPTLAPIDISTVTPVYAGESYLRALVGELLELRQHWEQTHAPVRLSESIFVVDGAIDHSEDVLRELAAEHRWLRVFTLARNFGQHPATMAGLSYSSGEWVVTLDEDLQHEPKRIPDLLHHAVANKLDVVYARPADAVHESWMRDFSSSSFKRLMARVTGNPFIPQFNSFRLMRGAVARAAASVSSHDTYFDVAVTWYTNRVGSVELPMKDRRYVESGKSGYNLRRLLSHARRLLVTSENKVLRLAALAGVAAIVGCFFTVLRVLAQKVFDPESIPVPGWTSLFITGLMVGGITLLLLSVIIEYLSIVLLHSQGKPVYFVVDRSLDEPILRYFTVTRRPPAST